MTGSKSFQTLSAPYIALNALLPAMRELGGRVVALLRRHPILWLPYLAADLLAVGLWRLRGLAEDAIVRKFSMGHSVLGGAYAIPPDGRTALARASIAYFPIGIAAIIASVCLFLAALLATAAILDSIEQEQRPDARKILKGIAARWRRILLLALSFLITSAVFIAGTMLLLHYSGFLTHRAPPHTQFWLLAALISVGVGCAAWLVMPATMRLLGGEAATRMSAQIRNQGTILTILAALAGTVFGFCLEKVEVSMLLNACGEIMALSVLNSLAANAPDALLFVALALLAAEPVVNPATPAEASPTPGLTASYRRKTDVGQT